jgi:hypothetical protein
VVTTAAAATSSLVTGAGRVKLSIALCFLVLAAIYIAGGAAKSVLDPDMFHQMALIREALAIGRLPLADPFAFTPTVEPMVHHEWGMGAVLYFVSTRFGGLGLALLRDLLALGIAIGCVLCARRRGASNQVLWATLPLAIMLAWIGSTTVRAQMVTLLFLAWLLLLIELDRAGRRWWIAPWLVMYVLWVNLHAGFVVGAIALGLYAIEQVMRRRPFAHLLAVGSAMAVLIAVNPYGLDYYSYLWHGLRMQRPLITEWQPITKAWWPIVMMYGFSLLLIAYGLYRRGPRHALEMLFVLAAAYAAARHQRHLSIYAVAWACHVPALLQGTPLALPLMRGLDPARRAVAPIAAAALVFCVAVTLYQKPWRPHLPANPGDHRTLIYPVGAVDYLRENAFAGNLVTPFTAGAFVTWNLYPDVLVSMDGRYEVAYAPGLLEEHIDFFAARDGWRDFLGRYRADAVLTRSRARVAAELGNLPGWRPAYRDDVYEIHVRADLELPTIDRRGERLTGSFP